MNLKVKISIASFTSGRAQTMTMKVSIEGTGTPGAAFEMSDGTLSLSTGGGEDREGIDAGHPSPDAVAAGTRAFLAPGNADRLGRSLAAAYEAMDAVRRMEKAVGKRRD